MTADGQYFYERCVQIHADTDEAASSIRRDHLEPRGTLRFTVTSAFGGIVILPLLNAFLKKWPDVEVEIIFTDRFIDLFEEGYDLGIRLGDMPNDSLMIVRPITKYRPFIYASPGYLENYGKPENISEVGAHQRLIYGMSMNHTNKRMMNDI